MRVVIRADDGDEIAIDVDDLATEQSVLRLELQNTTFAEPAEYESVTLTVKRARELADALIRMSDAIEMFHDERRRQIPIGAIPIGSVADLSASLDGPRDQ